MLERDDCDVIEEQILVGYWVFVEGFVECYCVLLVSGFGMCLCFVCLEDIVCEQVEVVLDLSIDFFVCGIGMLFEVVE